MTPAEVFHRAGVALYGEQYVAPMAVLLDADKNQVGKWRSGKSRVPLGVWGPIRAALLKRGPEIEGVLLEIGNQGFGTATSSDSPILSLTTIDDLGSSKGDRGILVRCDRARPNDRRPLHGASVEIDGRPCTIVAADRSYRIDAIGRGDTFYLAMKSPDTAEFLTPSR